MAEGAWELGSLQKRVGGVGEFLYSDVHAPCPGIVLCHERGGLRRCHVTEQPLGHLAGRGDIEATIYRLTVLTLVG